MTSEGLDGSPRHSLKDAGPLLLRGEVEDVFKKYIPQLYTSVGAFLNRSVGQYIPASRRTELTRESKGNERVRFVTARDLYKVVNPLLKEKGLVLPKEKIPLGFTHPRTRMIYLVTDTIPIHLTDHMYGHKTKKDRIAGIEGVARRVFTEEMVHSVQDLDNINGALAEYQAAFHVRDYFNKKKLRLFMFEPQDEAMATYYEHAREKFGIPIIESIGFGSFQEPRLKRALVNIMFNQHAETLGGSQKNSRIVR